LAEDWYAASIDRVEAAARSVHEAVDAVVAALAAARQERLAGRPLPAIVESLVARGGKETRRSADDAFREYTKAVTAYRAAAIQALVDEDGMTLSEVARITGVSRQMVARLYRIGADDRLT
jgi:hypothetical protein